MSASPEPPQTQDQVDDESLDDSADGSSEPSQTQDQVSDESADDSAEDLPPSKKLKTDHASKEPTVIGYDPKGLSDCTLRTNATIFKTHKAVLSIHSTFFSKLFASKFKEGTTGEVRLPDDDCISIGTILRYCYDKDVDMHELASQLFPAPDDSYDSMFFGEDIAGSSYSWGDADRADAFRFDQAYTATCFASEQDLDGNEDKNVYARRFKGLLKLMNLADKFGMTKLLSSARHEFVFTVHRLTRPFVAAWLIELVFDSDEEPSHQETLRRCILNACGSKWLTGAFLNSRRYRQVVTSYPTLASVVVEARQAFSTWHFMAVKCSEETCLSGQLAWSFYTSVPYWTSSIRCSFCAKQNLNFSMEELERPCKVMLSTSRWECRHCFAVFSVRSRPPKAMHSKFCIHCGTTHIDKLEGGEDENED